VTFIAGPSAEAHTTLTASPTTVVADYDAASTMTVNVRDANDNPVPGATVNFSTGAAGCTFSVGSDITYASGTTSTSVRSSRAGTATISAQVVGGSTFVKTADVAFTEPDREWIQWVPTPNGLANSNYVVSGGTVTDLTTRLVWQQTVDSGTYTWEGAGTYCANLAPVGSWRLPTYIELESLVDLAVSGSPATNRTVFAATPQQYFWTSSVFVDDSAYAWSVGLSYGHVYYADKITPYYVRCVR